MHTILGNIWEIFLRAIIILKARTGFQLDSKKFSMRACLVTAALAILHRRAECSESERPACSHFTSESADRKCQWQGRSNVRRIPENRALALSKRMPTRTRKPIFLSFSLSFMARHSNASHNRATIVANYDLYCYLFSLF